MTGEERRALARERVKRWKQEHPKSVKWQRERRYARQKAAKREVRVEAVKEKERKEPMLPRYMGETHSVPLALAEGDEETVFANARVVSKRTGRAIPDGLMEPNERGGHGDAENIGTTGERGFGQKDTGGPEAKTAEEKRVKAQLEEFARRQAAGGLGVKRGVKVEIKL